MLFRSFAISLAALVLLSWGTGGVAGARAHATPTPAATATPPPEDPEITAIARHEFVAWQDDAVEKSRYTPDMQTKMLDAQVAQTARGLASVGALEHAQWLGPYAAPPNAPGDRSYLFHMMCSNRAVYELLTLAPDGKIDGIAFRDTLE
jgi:hypothetical protein